MAAPAVATTLQQQQPQQQQQQQQQQIDAPPAFTYRGLQPGDFNVLKAAHADLFPINYEDNFFIRATHGLDRIWSCAAVSTDTYGAEQLVGFITAKSVFLHEVDASDRQHMGLLSAVLDHDRVLYIMTLGVLEGHRHRGLASTLISIACQHAYESRCRAVFLHVITYNTAAMSLYSRQGFCCVAKLRAFYYIATGRTPDPQQQVYDAYLFVLHVGGAAGLPSPWDLVSLAWSPLRLAFNRIHACMPGFCRDEAQQLQQPSLLNGQSTAGWENGSHTQQQQQHFGSHHQGQHPEQHWQSTPVLPSLPGSRQRYSRGPSLPIRHLHQHQQHHSHHLHHPYYHHPHYQQQQWPHDGQPAPQQSSVQDALPWPSHVSADEQQQQAQAQARAQPYMLHQAMQPPPQRMLRWLFNGASRGSSGVAVAGEQQQQQRHVSGEPRAPVSAAVRHQQWQDVASTHKQG